MICRNLKAVGVSDQHPIGGLSYVVFEVFCDVRGYLSLRMAEVMVEEDQMGS